MVTPAPSPLDQFQWEPQPKTQRFLTGIIQDGLSRCAPAARLAERMKAETGTRFFDWIDHLQLPLSDATRNELEGVGFTRRPTPGAAEVYVNLRGIFPEVVLEPGSALRLSIKVESVADFAVMQRLPDSIEIEGSPLSPMRRARAFAENGVEIWAVERHGWRRYDVPRQPFHDPEDLQAMAEMPTREELKEREMATVPDARLWLRHAEALRRRRRDFASDREGFTHVNALVDASILDLGREMTCDLFFAAEREYWQSRNRAAQFQKHRQDLLGLGWANHDHHTYRSSRESFAALVALWEKLGFHCRERFYAGAEAGWGAQVMEDPVTGITTFNDVDMSPEELMGDFSHTPMAERKALGTVGLWCALHGEALLQAGMHHLEAQFDWYALRDQLQQQAGVRTMDPFTAFPFLRQAFTEGERWPVDPRRIDRLLAAGRITKEQAEQFRTTGAIGSHLENLERNDGYKGFNQKGVSEIIAKTDPRRQTQAVGA